MLSTDSNCPKSPQLTQEILSAYLKLPIALRRNLFRLGHKGWVFMEQSSVGLKYSSKAKLPNDRLTIIQDIMNLSLWKYLEDSSKSGYSTFIPGDLQTILERSVKHLVFSGHIILKTISLEADNQKIIGFVLDDDSQITAQDSTYHLASLQLLGLTWDHYYKFRMPSLSNLVGISDLNYRYRGLPTIEVEDIGAIFNHKNYNYYEYFDNEDDFNNSGFLGTVQLIEGTFHVITEGYTGS